MPSGGCRSHRPAVRWKRWEVVADGNGGGPTDGERIVLCPGMSNLWASGPGANGVPRQVRHVSPLRPGVPCGWGRKAAGGTKRGRAKRQFSGPKVFPPSLEVFTNCGLAFWSRGRSLKDPIIFRERAGVFATQVSVENDLAVVRYRKGCCVKGCISSDLPKRSPGSLPDVVSGPSTLGGLYFSPFELRGR